MTDNLGYTAVHDHDSGEVAIIADDKRWVIHPATNPYFALIIGLIEDQHPLDVLRKYLDA